MKQDNQPDDFSDNDKAQYKALLGAAKLGKLGIIASVEKGTGKPVIVLVAKNDKPGGHMELVPLGTIFTENPVNLLETPDGFHVEDNGNGNDGNNLTITE